VLQVQPLIDQAKGLDEELKSKRYVLSDEALFGKQADLLELRNKIDSKIKELEGQLKIDQGRLEAPLIAKLRDIVQEIGKEQGFTLILQRNNPYLMYSREALDITDMVVARFNQKTHQWIEYWMAEPFSHNWDSWVDNTTNPVTVWYGDQYGFIVRIQPLE